ncbi:MAG: hypothetical protein HY423_15690 [Candidatus Lambdaproteobacteria bacterium]|nr:hypothetical protein [Candidatus Lambdaproteobacteria bacterium]
MKRLLLLAALILAATVGVLAVAQADENSPPYGWGGGWGWGMGPGSMGAGPGTMGAGPGMMGGGPGMTGGGPGMMGAGAGMMGGGMGMMGGGHTAWVADLPAEKRELVRKLQVSTMQQMIAKRSLLPELRLQLRNAMFAFPIDQSAARKARADIARIREELFQLHLATTAQMQQIVGKETWDKMHQGWGPGAGRGPGMGPGQGPGMMGPGQGPGMMGPGPGR